MIPNPVRSVYKHPIWYSSIRQVRCLRPSIKICKERFQLNIDVRQYNKDEIRVKAHPEYVIIEGKQERSTQQGYIVKQFIRRYKLPEGVVLQKVESKLSPEGILTITAPRSLPDPNLPCNTVIIPVSHGECEKEKVVKKVVEKVAVPKPTETSDPCKGYPKVKPIKKK